MEISRFFLHQADFIFQEYHKLAIDESLTIIIFQFTSTKAAFMVNTEIDNYIVTNLCKLKAAVVTKREHRSVI